MRSTPMLRVFVAVFVTLSAGVAPGDETAAPWAGPIQAEHVRPHVEFLASPKLAGRAGADAIQAADYVRQQLDKLKVKLPDAYVNCPKCVVK